MNTQETKLLNEGDVVYQCQLSNPENKLVIERVTNKHAISGNYKFKREYNDGYIKEFKPKQWSLICFYIENDELKLKYERKTFIRHINRIADTLTIKQIEKINEIINQKP